MIDRHRPLETCARGFTLVELLVTMMVMGLVAVILSTILISTNRAHRETTSRADVQGGTRTAMNLMLTELRQAGADPTTPPAGITAIMSADTNSIRVRADINADGTIQTTEPSEDVTYSYNPVTDILSRNPGSGAVTIMTQLTAFRYSYFDASGNALTAMPLSASDRALVHTILITMTCDDKDSAPFDLSTRITLRNQ